MRILLDECVPRRFKSSLSAGEHVCVTVPEAGLAGKTNGELLRLAEGKFDVFVTLDKGIRHQQNMAATRIAVVLIRSRSSRLSDLVSHASACRAAIVGIKPGEIVHIGQAK